MEEENEHLVSSVSHATADTAALLDRWRAGDRQAAGDLLQVCYAELHRIAAAYFRRERDDHTLQATAVIHEAYLAIAGQDGIEWQNRAHFIGFMAQVMRRVLIEHARQRGSQRRGGRFRKLTLSEASMLAARTAPDLEALEDALCDLEAWDPEKARLVELRFYGGLTIDESADVLGISRATAVRQWRRARSWLYRALNLAPASDVCAAVDEIDGGA